MCNLDFLYYTMKKFLLSSQSVLSALLLSACSPGPVDGEGSGLVTNDKIGKQGVLVPLDYGDLYGEDLIHSGKDSVTQEVFKEYAAKVMMWYRAASPNTSVWGSFGGTLTIGSAYEEASAYTSVPGNDCCHNSNFYGLHSEVHLLIMGREYRNPMPDKFSLFWGDEFEKKKYVLQT